jgi:transposase-like protein
MSKHRGREERRRLVGEWEVSGESAGRFARRAGVSEATLYRWRGLLSRSARRPGRAALAKIVEVRATQVTSVDQFEVRLACGRRVGVPVSFDAEALSRLLVVLEARS